MSSIIPLFEKFKIHLISLLTVIYFSRMSLPFVKYVFFPLLIIITMYATYSTLKDKVLWHVIVAFLSAFILLVINLIIHSLGMLKTELLHIFIVKEYFNSVTVVIMAFVLYSLIDDKEMVKEYFRKTSRLTIIAGFIIALFSFLKFFLDLKGFQFDLLNPDDYPLGTSLTNDRNFFSLFGLFSLILLIPVVIRQNSSRKSLAVQFILLVLSTSIILTTSRRAILILTVLLVTLIVIYCISLFRKNNPVLRNIVTNTRYFFISFWIVIGTVTFLVSTVGLYRINNTLVKKGFDPDRFKLYTTILTFQLKSLVVANIDVTQVHASLWMRDDVNVIPFSGDGNMVLSKMRQLPQDKYKKTTPVTNGIKINGDADYRVTNNTAYSYTRLINYKTDSNSFYEITAWCFVSGDFNGDCVIMSPGKNKLGIQQYNYDLRLKNTWQKLKVAFATDTVTTQSVYMGFSKFHALDFDDFTGYVIFSFDTIHVINDSIATEIFVSNKKWEKTFIYDPALHEDALLASADGLMNSSLAVPRIERWKYAWSIYTTRYSVWNKLFGNGFTYMSMFGNRFLKGKSDLDWPHNPVLSTLLYSGIAGVMFYVYFLGVTIFLYWKYFRQFWPIALCFAISLFFAIFSGNNSLDPPIMGIFMMFPYLINHIYRKESGLE